MELKPSTRIRVELYDPKPSNREVLVGQFSGGEIQVRVGDIPQALTVKVIAHIDSARAVMELLLVTDAIRRQRPNVNVDLVLPYLPYARQDRVCEQGEALSLAVFANLINSQRYGTVTIADCHSDVGLALINNVIHVTVNNLTKNLPLQDWVLVAPDAGALKKVSALAKHRGTRYIRADKSRDPATGEITGTVVYSNHLGKQDVLIVDDICDGGRTFISLAERLRLITDGRVMLYITHGIFSQGIPAVLKHFDAIYCANSFIPCDDPRFVTI